jgi:pimeloyl-ACP methyl ester carboxylesterase
VRTIVQFALAVIAATTTPAQSPDLGAPPGRLVDVGGRRMHLHCSGSGSPTVVIEAGASSFAIDFTLVQREVAKSNRVCSYDRAGSGWSDRADSTNRRRIHDDLHELLTRAGEKAPYVIVGASAGGLYVREFQASHPAEIVGMVLIDAASEDRLFTVVRGEARPIASITAEEQAEVIPRRTFALRKRSPQTGTPFDKLPPELYATRIKLDERLIAAQPDSVTPEQAMSGAEAERQRLAGLLDARKANPRPLGSIPVVVLTRDQGWSPGLHETHAVLAALSDNSRHTRVPGAGHEIHLFQPDAVVQAITDVAESARTKARLRP